MKKTCKECGETKPATDYYDGKRICKNCCIANQLRRYYEDPDLHREAAQAYYWSHREQVITRVKAYKAGR